MANTRETILEKDQMLDLIDKDFKSCIINMFIKVKKDISKESKGSIRMMSNQIDNINNIFVSY